MKVPKKWECKNCGFKSKNSKTLRIGGLGFARCSKCSGSVKESEEWLKWYNEEMEIHHERLRNLKGD